MFLYFVSNIPDSLLQQVFAVRFLGSMAVRAGHTQEVIYEAMRQVLAARAIHNIFKTTESHLMVTSSCIRCVPRLPSVSHICICTGRSTVCVCQQIDRSTDTGHQNQCKCWCINTTALAEARHGQQKHLSCVCLSVPAGGRDSVCRPSGEQQADGLCSAGERLERRRRGSALLQRVCVWEQHWRREGPSVEHEP